MTALVMYQITGYVRSYRAIYPLLTALLIAVLVAAGGGGGTATLLAGQFGDVAAFLVPIGGWACRALLDTEPDVQQDLATLAVRGRTRSALACLASGLVAALALGSILTVVPLLQALSGHLAADQILAGLALQVLAAIGAAAFGALTSRAIIPSTALSVVALLGGALALLLLSMSPLAFLSLPMIGWDRAAHHGDLVTALPGTTLHVLLWTAVAAALYVALRTIRH